MFSRLLTFAVRSFVRGPGKSWLFTSGALGLVRFARNRMGRRQVIDLSSTKPGDRIVIEHLPVTHEEQIKAGKVAKRQRRQAQKSDKRAAKRLAAASSRGGKRSQV